MRLLLIRKVEDVRYDQNDVSLVVKVLNALAFSSF